MLHAGIPDHQQLYLTLVLPAWYPAYAAHSFKQQSSIRLTPCMSPKMLHQLHAGVRQANRIRHAYLASVLQQEVAFFDVEASSGNLLHGLNEDTVTIQAAIGEKVGNFVHHLFTFVVGIAIG